MGKVESWSKIKDGNRRAVLVEVKLQRIWKEYFGDMYNMDAQEQV